MWSHANELDRHKQIVMSSRQISTSYLTAWTTLQTPMIIRGAQLIRLLRQKCVLNNMIGCLHGQVSIADKGSDKN